MSLRTNTQSSAGELRVYIGTRRGDARRRHHVALAARARIHIRLRAEGSLLTGRQPTGTFLTSLYMFLLARSL